MSNDDGTIDFGKNPFELIHSDSHAVLRLSGALDPDLLKEFERRMRPKIDELRTDLIIDLRETGAISPIWTRTLMQIVGSLKASHHRLRVVSNSPRHRQFFQEQGVGASFPIELTLEEAVKAFAVKPSKKFDVAFLKPFLDGAVDVLKIQCMTAAKFGGPEVKDPASEIEGEIVGLVSLASTSFQGVLALSFQRKTLLEILCRYHKEEIEELTPKDEAEAAMITNLIFGYAKRVLSQQGSGLKSAIPTVLLGPKVVFPAACRGPRLRIPFESDAGPFAIEICAGDPL